MPANRKANESRRLTVAGLIAVTAATLLMMAWAIFPTAALADQQISVNPGSLSSHTCDDSEWHFVITQIDDLDNPKNGNEDEAPTSIHVTWANGSSADLPLDDVTGKTAHYFFFGNLNSTVTSATATIYTGWSGMFNLSHGPCGTTTTTTTVPTTTTTVPTTTTTVPTTTTTVPTTTTTVATTTTTTTTTTVPTTTTTVPGGGGGGGTTTVPVTTTTTPTVGPTTVQPSTTTKSPNVAPTTVSPRGTAFTGVENVVPIGAIALMLMTSGTGLLWAGSRGKRDQNQDEE
jgi:hypothetical protein